MLIHSARKGQSHQIRNKRGACKILPCDNVKVDAGNNSPLF